LKVPATRTEPLAVRSAYDVTSDGKRFLINTAGGSGAASPPLTVVDELAGGREKGESRLGGWPCKK
jgi:hypothetical protein